MSNPESGVQQPPDLSDEQPGDVAQQASCPPEASAESPESCDADAFMDEEDADAVAERLRQLGYI